MTYDELSHLEDYIAILQHLICQENNYKEEPYETTLMQIQFRRICLEDKIILLEYYFANFFVDILDVFIYLL